MPAPGGPTWRNGRLGCAAVGPGAIVVSIVTGLFGGWLAGLLLAPGLTADEATRGLQIYLMNQANTRMRDAVRAAGLAAPDRAALPRLSDELVQIRGVRVRRVNVRPELFWTFSQRGYCIARMELDAPPTEAPTVRYFRTVCSWMTASRIQWETTAAHYRFPI